MPANWPFPDQNGHFGIVHSGAPHFWKGPCFKGAAIFLYNHSRDWLPFDSWGAMGMLSLGHPRYTVSMLTNRQVYFNLLVIYHKRWVVHWQLYSPQIQIILMRLVIGSNYPHLPTIEQIIGDCLILCLFAFMPTFVKHYANALEAIVFARAVYYWTY